MLSRHTSPISNLSREPVTGDATERLQDWIARLPSTKAAALVPKVRQPEWVKPEIRVRVRHLFCKRCGIMTFGRGVSETGEFFAVNLACLDDGAVADLTGAPIRDEDGRNDRSDAALGETRHL